jgi:uncharacterized protein YejL (UPF0352 family)
MDIKGTEEKLNQVDSLLTTLTKILKKHWLILSLILLGTFVYFSLTDDSEYVEEYQTEEVSQYDESGDSIYVEEDISVDNTESE